MIVKRKRRKGQCLSSLLTKVLFPTSSFQQKGLPWRAVANKIGEPVQSNLPKAQNMPDMASARGGVNADEGLGSVICPANSNGFQSSGTARLKFANVRLVENNRKPTSFIAQATGGCFKHGVVLKKRRQVVFLKSRG